MPFKSEAQRKYLWANVPEIARDWTDTYGSGIQAAHGGRIGFRRGTSGAPGGGDPGMTSDPSGRGQTHSGGGGGWSPGVGGTQHIPTPRPDPRPDPKPSHLGLGKLIQRKGPKPTTYAEQIYNKMHPFFMGNLGKSPRGLYSPVNLTQHGTRLQNLASIYSKGFKGSKVPTWAGTGKTFTSNLDVAGRYGKQIPVVSSKFNLTSPFGGGFNKAGISFGPEVVQSPSQATKGMNLASKLGVKSTGPFTGYTGPTATRIMNTPGITSMAGPALSKIAGGLNVASLPIGYVEIAKGLQNRLESQGMPTGALSEDILGRGAMGAGADVLSVPDRYGSSQDVP